MQRGPNEFPGPLGQYGCHDCLNCSLSAGRRHSRHSAWVRSEQTATSRTPRRQLHQRRSLGAFPSRNPWQEKILPALTESSLRASHRQREGFASSLQDVDRHQVTRIAPGVPDAEGPAPTHQPYLVHASRVLVAASNAITAVQECVAYSGICTGGFEIVSHS